MQGKLLIVRWVMFAVAGLGLSAEARAAPPQLGLPEPEPHTIVGGEVVAEGEYTEVVALAIEGFACTGVLVSPTLILTAAHCLSNRDPGALITIHTGVERGTMADAQAVDFGAHPDFNANAQASDVLDYGYIVSDRELPGPYAVPITDQEEFDFAMQWDREVTIVGYGKFDSAVAEDGTKRELTVSINGFSPAGLEFFAGGDGKDSCEGDSGGPVFVTLADGSRRLAGLISRGSMVCGSKGIYSVAHEPLCWVRDASGIDVTGQCGSCDCIDTTPPPEPKEGCGCVTSPRTSGWAWSWALLLVAARRRREY
ncbi:MAG: trypsin-like serine protease [Myxococcota bacterium]